MSQKSRLEQTLFDQLVISGLMLNGLCEYRFDPVRMWRFDFAWPEQMLAVEVEGGIWSNGRHTRGAGFIADLEKYNTAVLCGWRVLRFSSNMIESGAAVRQIEIALGVVREVNDSIPF